MMLVEINLLPKKEPKKAGILSLLVFFLVIAAAGAGLLYWLYAGYQDKTASLQSQIVKTEEAIAMQNQVNTELADSDSAAELGKIVGWAESYPLETVQVLRQLIGLLPERGFFMNFAYNDDATINLSVQFDSSRQAAYYLHELTETEMVTDAKLTGISTMKITETDQTGTELTDSAGKLDNDPYLPRYTAEYEIKINSDTVKKAQAEQDGKEGDTKNEGES